MLKGTREKKKSRRKCEREQERVRACKCAGERQKGYSCLTSSFQEKTMEVDSHGRLTDAHTHTHTHSHTNTHTHTHTLTHAASQAFAPTLIFDVFLIFTVPP